MSELDQIREEGLEGQGAALDPEMFGLDESKTQYTPNTVDSRFFVTLKPANSWRKSKIDEKSGGIVQWLYYNGVKNAWRKIGSVSIRKKNRTTKIKSPLYDKIQLNTKNFIKSWFSAINSH